MQCSNPNCAKEILDQAAMFCPFCGTKVEQKQQRDPQDITAIWPEWQKVKEIGKGSYGTVYQAVRRDNGVESHAAIKVISVPSNSAELDSLRSEGYNEEDSRTYLKDVVDSFVREIQLMETMKGYQNIVSVEDYKVLAKTDMVGWDIYIRMELLTSFNEYTSNKTLTEQEVIQLGCDICTALEICGRRNVIHRDIKPENIFVNDLGNYKLGDFGIARELENKTAGLSQKGTFNYMAPEVSKNMNYDATIDLYSLGIVLYRLMNHNRLPFYDLNKQLISHSERERALNRRMQGEPMPAPCDASPALAEVILRACAYNPKDRYASATEMKEALLQAKRGVVLPQPIQTPLEEDLDKTVAVRRAQKGGDGGSAVPSVGFSITPNGGGDAKGVEPEVKVDTFGPKDGGKKSKKTLVLGIIAAVLSVCILFGGATIGVAVAIINSISGDDKESTITEEPSYVESYEESNSSYTQAHIPDYSSTYLSGAAASSYLNEAKANIQHTPNRVADGKMDTGWVEGASGYGENQYVQLQFDRECYVSGFTIWGGYHKSQDLYAKNSRPARIQITFSDGSHYYSNLSDVMQPQKITFSQKIATKEVTITIVSVYHGSKYEDTVISEISLF